MCFLRFNCCYENKNRINENAYSKYNERNEYSNECGCKDFDRDDYNHDENRKKSNCCYYKCVTLCCSNIYNQHEDNKRDRCDCDRRKNSYWD